MQRVGNFPTVRNTARAISLASAALLATLSLAGCLVAGYSSSGGAFIWPGGLGLFVVILLVFFLLRRRR